MVHCTRGPDVNAPRRREAEGRPRWPGRGAGKGAERSGALRGGAGEGGGCGGAGRRLVCTLRAGCRYAGFVLGGQSIRVVAQFIPCRGGELRRLPLPDISIPLETSSVSLKASALARSDFLIALG